MRFQVSGLDGENPVIGSVALGEPIARKSLPVIKNLVGDLCGNAFLARSGYELLAVLKQHIRFFLGHTLSQVVGFRSSIARQVHGSIHDLLLVHRDPISFLEDRFKGLVSISDLFLAVHAGDIAGDEFHGPGAEERHHGDDVVQVLGLHLHQIAAHP